MGLRCALVGCGVIAPTHFDAIRAYPDAEVTAICDLRQDRLDGLAKKYPGAKTVSDYRELLDPKAIDALFVLTEHHNHTAIVSEALAAGLHVLCEKPVAAHPAQLDELFISLQTKKTLAGGIFQHRFEPHNRVLKSCYEEGLLGTGLTISLEHRCLRTDEYYASDAWRGTLAEEGGSLLINQSIHFLDLLRYIGGEVKSLSCHTNNRTHEGIIETEDTAVGSLIFTSGLMGNFACTASSNCDEWKHRITLSGSEATVVLTDGEYHISATEKVKAELEKNFASAKESEETKASSSEKKYYGGAHKGNIFDFLDSVINKKEPEITLESAAQTTALVHSLYESAKQQTTISFNL